MTEPDDGGELDDESRILVELVATADAVLGPWRLGRGVDDGSANAGTLTRLFRAGGGLPWRSGGGDDRERRRASTALAALVEANHVAVIKPSDRVYSVRLTPRGEAAGREIGGPCTWPKSLEWLARLIDVQGGPDARIIGSGPHAGAWVLEHDLAGIPHASCSPADRDYDHALLDVRDGLMPMIYRGLVRWASTSHRTLLYRAASDALDVEIETFADLPPFAGQAGTDCYYREFQETKHWLSERKKFDQGEIGFIPAPVGDLPRRGGRPRKPKAAGTRRAKGKGAGTKSKRRKGR